jgi:hypothetical protein
VLGDGECSDDEDTDTDTLGALACGPSQIAKWSGTFWYCSPDEGTTYSAGNQLNLVGTEFNVLEGSGSGLDADTLDSHNTDYFATSVHSHFGQLWSGASSYGLQVENTASGGVGLIGEAIGNSGQGVRGWASASTGFTKGVEGLSSSSDGQGVYGQASSPTGNTYGVYGVSYSTSGYGVYGNTTSATGPSRGVLGTSQSVNGIGVYGEATATSGATRGVYGRSDSTGGSGVYGYVGDAIGENYGVQGRTESPAGYGGFFNNAAGGVDIMAGGSGDVAQTADGNGLVKAAAIVSCTGLGASILRSFNNVPGAGPVSITLILLTGDPFCEVDFGFDLTDRFWSATQDAAFYTVACAQSTTSNTALGCYALAPDFTFMNFGASVLIY